MRSELLLSVSIQNTISSGSSALAPPASTTLASHPFFRPLFAATIIYSMRALLELSVFFPHKTINPHNFKGLMNPLLDSEEVVDTILQASIITSSNTFKLLKLGLQVQAIGSQRSRHKA
jgi:hypothetical protein